MFARAAWPLSLFLLTFAPLAEAGPPTVSVSVGGRHTLWIPGAHGVILDDSELAEVGLGGGGAVQVEGRQAGAGSISVFSANGKVREYQLVVRPGVKGVARARTETAYEDLWDEPRFGGERISHARCELPFAKRSSAKAFRASVRLLRKGSLEAAVRRLERLKSVEPESATLYLYLGTALAQQREYARGAAALETFALSCEDDPRTASVTRILREYERRAQPAQRTAALGRAKPVKRYRQVR